MGPLDTNKEKMLDTATDDTYAYFEQLIPCGKYNVSITPITLNDAAAPATDSTFETEEARPSPIRNYNYVPDTNSMFISWEKPNFADLCITGYRVSGWNDENKPETPFDQTVTEESVTVKDLKSCQSYTVQIIPITKTMDGELQHIETETKAKKAKAPENFLVVRRYAKAFDLNVVDLDTNNKCENIFARVICEASAGYDVPCKIAEQYFEGQVGAKIFKGTISPLSPNTKYKCNVSLLNVAGWSQNNSIIETTGPYFPESPQEIGVKSSTSSSINFNWKAPKYANGNIKLYITHLQRVGAAYYIPPKCLAIVTDADERQTSSLEQSFTNLLPYTTYSLQVAAQNEYGIGEYTRPFRKITQPSISGPVTNLNIFTDGPYGSDLEYKASVNVSWISPCVSNGIIEHFILEFIGERMDHEREHFERLVLPVFNEDGGVSHKEEHLRPEYNYTVSVVVKTVGMDKTSSTVISEFDAPAGIPKKPSQHILGQATVNAYDASNPTHSALVRFPATFLESDSGTILFVALLLSEKSCNPEPDLSFGAIKSIDIWPDSYSWNEVYRDSNCVYQYQTTPIRWKPTVTSNDNLKREASSDMVEYNIGTSNCNNMNEVCTGTTTKCYCNGPLKPDTEYNLVIRLFTNSGFNDVSLLEFKTDSLIEMTIILVSVSGCLFLALIVGFIYLYITKRILRQRESYHDIIDSFGDVTAKNFAIYYREVAKPEKIAREFKELTAVAMDLSYSAAELGSNKNRYADIFPYDKNRVILDIDADGSDYINASFIDGYRRKKEYIATQGPKRESVCDFWRMVLQHNIRVIVMVTQFREGDVVKCNEYFPYKFKGISVVVKRKETFEIYDRTEMIVTHSMYGLKQKVNHFYFKKWPDHGCPVDPLHLISFVRKVKAEKIPKYSPIVVHCSAGVGRTGTFIGLDIIMQRLKNESKLNVYEIVKKLRFQRMKMVQTQTQYAFLYSCAFELVKHKAIKYQNNNKKQVSFDTDPELNKNTTFKFNLRRNDSDLSSVAEEDTKEVGSRHNGKPREVGAFNAPAIRFSHFRKASDLESLDEEVNKSDIYTGNSTESAM